MRGQSRKRPDKKRTDWKAVGVQFLSSVLSGLVLELLKKFLNL